MLRNAVQRYIIFIASILFLASCSSDRFDVQMERDRVPVTIVRLDSILLSAQSPEDLCSACLSHETGCADYMFAFNVRPVLSQETCRQLFGMINDPRFFPPSLSQHVRNVWNAERMARFEEDMSKLFAYYSYYFNRPVPRIYMVAPSSGYQVAGFSADTALLIGMDMYLGDTFDLYEGEPKYLVRTWKYDYAVQNVAKTMMGYIYNEDSLTDKTLLSKMLFAGKKVLLTQMLVPEMADSLRLGMTSDQYKWCVENEQEIWAHLTGEKMLFNTSEDMAQKYLGEAPFTSAPNVPPMSAPRFAEYVGWRILLSYLDKNPGLTLKQVLEEKNAEKILNKSGYKPR